MILVCCPICLTETPAAEQYCTSCGSVLGDVTPYPVDPTPSVPEPQPTPSAHVDDMVEAFYAQFVESRRTIPRGQAEKLRSLFAETKISRRYATIIFVDLRGYTRLTQVLGEEKIKELRSWFNSVCSNAVERYEGFLIQFLGDAAFAAFGAPWAFEKDAESAIRCLVDIREEIRRKGSFEGEPLAIRAGAANGIINVEIIEESGIKRPDLIGPAVNLAARLEAHADTWDILIPSGLAEIVSNVFSLEERPAFTPKNYGEVVVPYAVLGLADRRQGGENHRTGFVGRKSEIATIQKRAAVGLSGGFAATRIEGPAGIGKSRLVSNALRESAPLYWVSIDPADSNALMKPIVLLLMQVGGVEQKSISERLSHIDSLAGGLEPAVRKALGFLLGGAEWGEGIAELPPASLHQTVESAAVEVLTRICARTPSIIVIDDVHCCDRMSQSLLMRLVASKPPGLSLFVIGREGSSTPDAGGKAATAAPADWTTGGEWVSVIVPPLSADDARTVVAELIDVARIDPRLHRRILESSGGNPFFLTELARQSQSKNVAESGGGNPAEDHDFMADTSRRVVEMLQARADALPDSQRTLLQYASVLGRRFDRDTLELLPEYQGGIMDELAALIGAKFLRRQSFAPDAPLEFAPPTLRDAVYNMMTPQRQRELHSTIAPLMETKFKDSPRDHFQIASHWIKGGHFSRARPYLRTACDWAVRLGMPQEAYQVARLALDLVSPQDDERTPNGSFAPSISLQQRGLLHGEAGRAARGMFRFDKALKHFRSWHRIAEEVNNPLWQCLARHQEAVTLFELGSVPETLAILEDLLLVEDVAPIHKSKFRKSLGDCLLRQGHYREALAIFLDVAATAQSLTTVNAGDCYNSASICYQKLDDAAEAFRCLEKAKTHYMEAGSSFGECVFLVNRAVVLEREGDFQGAISMNREALSKAEGCGYLHGISAATANLANLSYLAREYGEALVHAERAGHFGKMISHSNSVIVGAINRALALEGLGRFPEALTELDNAIALAKKAKDLDMLDEAKLEKAWTLFRASRIEECEAALDEFDSTESAHLSDFLVTVTAALQSKKNGALEPVLEPSGLEPGFGTLSKPTRLRRVDALLHLIATGLVKLPEGDVRALRDRIMKAGASGA